MSKKTNQRVPVTWGELLRIQEEQIEITAILRRAIRQSLLVNGMTEGLLQRSVEDAGPVIEPIMRRAA